MSRQLEQHRAHRCRLVTGERAAFDQFDEVRQIGQGQAPVQQRRVADLQRVTRLDEFGRGPAGDPGRGAEVSLGRTHSGHGALPPASSSPTNRVGAPPLTRNTCGPCTRPARHPAIRAAIALAPNTGSRKTPSVCATKSRRGLPRGGRGAVPRPDPSRAHVWRGDSASAGPGRARPRRPPVPGPGPRLPRPGGSPSPPRPGNWRRSWPPRPPARPGSRRIPVASHNPACRLHPAQPAGRPVPGWP